MEAELGEYKQQNQYLLRELEQIESKFQAIFRVRDSEKAKVEECFEYASRIRENVSSVYRMSKRKTADGVDVHDLDVSWFRSSSSLPLFN